MAIDRTADNDYMLENCGVSVVLGTTAGFGKPRYHDDGQLAASPTNFAVAIESVLVRTGFFPGLAEGASISVGGVAYRVQSALRVTDGAFTRVSLAKV